MLGRSVEKDINLFLAKFPSFSIREKTSEKVSIQGNWMAKAGKYELGYFELLIELHFSRYPQRFPIVFELSDKIPNDIDRHIKQDGSICFANLYDEMKECKRGLNLSIFFDRIVNPHLVRECERERLGYYPNGERSHNHEGHWESMYELFNTRDKHRIMLELKAILINNRMSRNGLCFCNSGRKYKACHEKILRELQTLGTQNLKLFLEVLNQTYRNEIQQV